MTKQKCATHWGPSGRYTRLVSGVFVLLVCDTCTYLLCVITVTSGLFYFTLGNLAPKYRSKVSMIQLSGIVKKTVIDEYGMNTILKPFVDDLKKLVCIMVV